MSNGITQILNKFLFSSLTCLKMTKCMAVIFKVKITYKLSSTLLYGFGLLNLRDN